MTTAVELFWFREYKFIAVDRIVFQLNDIDKHPFWQKSIYSVEHTNSVNKKTKQNKNVLFFRV